MDNKAAIVAITWIAVAVIAAVYMIVFGDKLGDLFFGVIIPVGLLVIVALAVTFKALENGDSK